IVTIDAASTELTVELNNGDGTFTPTTLGACSGFDLTVGDLNGDRRPDIAVACGQQQAVETFIQQPNGDYEGHLIPWAGLGEDDQIYSRVGDVAIGDINGDGRADLVATTQGIDGNQITSFIKDSTADPEGYTQAHFAGGVILSNVGPIDLRDMDGD